MTKIAIVTGASSGIGKEIHYFLMKSGYKVIGISRGGPEINFDLQMTQDYDLLLSEIKERSENFVEPLYLLVNNAGIMPLPESDLDPADLIGMLNLNVLAVYFLIQNLQGFMREGSQIINIASVAGLTHEEDVPLYSATKAAVISLTKSSAKVLAKFGIRVNCISPGFFKTNLVEGDTPDFLIEGVPLGREAETEEIIPVIKYLMESTYTTGANIVIDGGVSL